MKNGKDPSRSARELEEEDKLHILQVFLDEIVPKLRQLDARLGTLNCRFAGEKYRYWNLHFNSAGSDFRIIDFEYDEDSRILDLDA